jgi:hypothetical protein
MNQTQPLASLHRQKRPAPSAEAGLSALQIMVIPQRRFVCHSAAFVIP